MTASRAGRAAIDGGARGNPGEAGCGVVLELAAAARSTPSTSASPPTTSPSTQRCWPRSSAPTPSGLEELAVRSDSQLLVEQMNGGYRVKAPHLKPLWLRARTLAAGFRRFSIVHVPRERNRAADALANRAMDAPRLDASPSRGGVMTVDRAPWPGPKVAP